MNKNSMARLSQEASQLLLKIAAVRHLDHDARTLLFHEWRRFFGENQVKLKDQIGLMKHILVSNQEHRVEREGRKAKGQEVVDVVR